MEKMKEGREKGKKEKEKDGEEWRQEGAEMDHGGARSKKTWTCEQGDFDHVVERFYWQ